MLKENELIGAISIYRQKVRPLQLLEVRRGPFSARRSGNSGAAASRLCHGLAGEADAFHVPWSVPQHLPLILARTCIRHLLFPVAEGDRHGFPARILAP
jgi:hypothetical protein